MSTASHAITTRLNVKGSGDCGYTYISYHTMEGPGASKNKYTFYASTQNKSAVRFVFHGTLSTSPGCGSLLACQAWGVDFYMQPRTDVKNGDFSAAWVIPECIETHTKTTTGDLTSVLKTNDANVCLDSETINVDFSYQPGHMLPHETLEVDVRIFKLIAPKDTLKKDMVLKRPKFEPGIEVVDNGPAVAFKSLQLKAMVEL